VRSGAGKILFRDRTLIDGTRLPLVGVYVRICDVWITEASPPGVAGPGRPADGILLPGFTGTPAHPFSPAAAGGEPREIRQASGQAGPGSPAGSSASGVAQPLSAES
jgi:hypothetical protein